MRTARLASSIALVSALGLTAAAPAFAQRAAVAAGLSADGVLRPGGPVDARGRYHDTRTIVLRAGEGVEVAVASEMFDTWVRVTGPGGLRVENDDAQGEGTNARVRFRARRSGPHRITVTSYNAGETGEFRLEVLRGVVVTNDDDDDGHAGGAGDVGDPDGDGGCQPGACASPAPQPVPSPSPSGAGPEVYTYDPASGRFVGGSATAQAAVPPPGVAVQFPSPRAAPGDAPPVADGPWGNDDDADDTSVPQAPPVAPRGTDAAAGSGAVYGIFVGVSDYGGHNDLQHTAQDARDLASAFRRSGVMRPGDAVVLTDAQATHANVRQAFQTVAQRARERDTVVFFFDGHGDHGTISLRSGAMSAQELAALLDGVRGQHLLVVDACHSGSLAPVVQGRPGRMGLFSSRADETSYVASEVGAGGWLAHFVIQAVRSRHGGADGLQLGELSSYVQRGYGQRVRARQHLVVVAGPEGSHATLWGGPRRASGAVARR